MYLEHYRLIHIALLKLSHQFLPKAHIFEFKNLFKKLDLGQYGLAHIVHSRILYKYSPNAHISFGLKNLLKNCIRNIMVWPIFFISRILFKGSCFFFLFQKSLKEMHNLYFCLTPKNYWLMFVSWKYWP